MALPILVQNNPVISNGNVAGNLTSGPIDVKEIVRYSVQAVWSGTSPAGTLKVQVSNDGINFDDVANNSITVSGNSGSGIVEFPSCDYAFVEVNYTAASGSGTLTAYLCGKRK